MSKISFKVNKENEGIKLKEYLRMTAQLSGRLMKGAAKEGRITVNGKRVNLRYVLREEDVIEVNVIKEESQDIVPEQIELDIVYEDEDVIVINKKPFMVVHPTKSYPLGTLANGLLYYFKEKGENCIVRLVSRLDMNTSGLILVAKNQYAHMALARDMSKKEFEKSYLAIIHGNLKEIKGTINSPIYRPSEETIKRIVDEKGQESITHFKVLENYKEASLVKLTLETGRTHQIRVHMSHIGHPLYGDTLYGLEGDEEYINRQALHAYKLSFPHPRSGDVISLESKLPEDMENLIKKVK